MAPKIRASIIGATGYTGIELLRLLLLHPNVEIAYLTSRQHPREKIGNLYPHLANYALEVTDTSPADVAKNSDVVFLALPHKTAQDIAAELHGKVKLIDLSADFRLDDAETYAAYYEEHKHPQLLKEFVYGLAEVVGRDTVAKAQSVANPGCFALVSQLLLHPFKGHIVQADIFAMTGSSGAGKTPVDGTHHPVRNHNVKSYNVNKHRHIPEIIRTGGIAASQLNFVPTSGPFSRGIFAQAFLTLDAAVAQPETVYANCPFIRIQKSVEVAGIVGSNFADLHFSVGTGGRVLAQGAIDNLVKGAGGSAIQNMNLMFNFDEGAGLAAIAPLYP
ncbi:MAG: N-acetyl-gamma-glutamyl-phosphate reductase [Micavibrio sp.]|nr:N-acetyl-gamma-glutamyl-phosphate reductase [Micavibrio sp.]